MSIYENYTLSIDNDKLVYSYLDKKLFEISSNSNISLVKINAPEYNFLNLNYGFSMDANNRIIYNSSCNLFQSDVYVSGKIDAKEFPSRIPILDNLNKIPLSYLPNINSSVIYNSNSIGIGITSPLAKLHIRGGDAYIQEGRLGIGTLPAYYFHLDKAEVNDNFPAFVISSNNSSIINIYSERKTVIINKDDTIDVDPTVKLNVNGFMKTKSLAVSNVFITSNENTYIYNTLNLSNINSTGDKVIFNSNVDVIINNNSIKSLITNINTINNSLSFSNNFNVDSQNNQFVIKNNSNQLTIDNNYIRTSNLITSNLTLINYDSLTSNPYKDSVFDIKGKIKLYNDTPNIITNIYANTSKLFIVTETKTQIYNLTTKDYATTTINLNLTNALFRTKGNNYGYYINSNLYINGNLILTSVNIIDFVLTDNEKLFYIINSNNILLRYLINIDNNLINYFISLTLPGGAKALKIDSYRTSFVNNKLVVLANNNNLYCYTGSGTIFTVITGITGTIIDFACGDAHTIVRTTNGVFSFGSNENNNKFYKGYSSVGINQSEIVAQIIPFFLPIKVVKVKAFSNNSLVIDENGYVYIFGSVNRQYLTTMIYKIGDMINIDFCCSDYDVYLLSYFNDIFQINDINTNATKILILPDIYYGTSIKSRGSIVIGGNNFYPNPTFPTPRNSLLVENFVGIGSNIIGNTKYSLVISGNVNIQNGALYSNDQLYVTSTANSPISGADSWLKMNNDIYYLNGNVGIGIRYPKELLHINGNSMIDSNLYVRGKIVTNDYKPIVVNKEKEVYYVGKFGLNQKKPLSTFDLYDGDFKITNVLPHSTITPLNNFQLNVINTSTNTPYINPLVINDSGTIIVTSFYNHEINYNNNNNNNVEIYLNSNNKWNTYRINNIINGNTAFGQSLAIADSNIYIGAYKESFTTTSGASITTITGGIYLFNFDTNNQLSKKQLITYNTGGTYYQIGINIHCSGDGNVIISTINNYNKLLYINNKNKGTVTILDFNDYNYYQSTFIQDISYNAIQTNAFNPRVIYIDSNKDGSLIIINYIYFAPILISNFQFFNFYIIKNNEIYLLKTPNGFTNSFVTSLSMSGDGTRLFITTQLGFHFIYDVDFLNINHLTTRIANINIDVKYFDVSPSYTFELNDINAYRGKISKSGTNIYIGNYNKIVNYKFDNLKNQWINQDILTIPNIHNYSFDMDYYGYNLSVSQIKKLTDTTTTDTIEISNQLISSFKDNVSLYLYNSNLNINVHTTISCNLYCLAYYGDGSNISNIQITNIVNKNGNNGVIFSSNKLLYDSSNFIWNNTSNYLYINGQIYVNSNISVNSNLYVGSNIYVASNIHISSNVYANTNVYVTSNIYANSNIYAGLNIYANSNIYATYDIITFYNIISRYGNIISGSNIYASNNIISQSNIETLYGSITSSLNITATSNITTNKGSIISASNITANLNITTVRGSITSASNITATSNIITLRGSIFSACNIIGYSNLEIYSNITTVSGSITSASNIIANNNIIGLSNIDINSNIRTIYGSINSASNITATSNIITLRGSIFSACNIIGYSNLDIYSNITTVSGSITSASNITATSNIYARLFFGDGSNINNVRAENVIGIELIKYGGTGRSNLPMNGLLIGNDTNQIIVTSNLLWNNERLIFSNNATLIISNVAPIINIPFVSNSHFAQIINTSNGGTGNNSYHNNSILFYSNQFQTNSNLFWCNIDNSLRINGHIYGIGSNITAINPTNFISNVPVSHGGTGSNFYNPGELLYGNGINNLLTTRALAWDNSKNTLNVSNINVFDNILLNGVNTSNLDANKIINIISLSNGGIGTSNINKGELLFGVDNRKLGSTSNIKWDDVNLTLQVQSNIFASNIYSCNFSGNGFQLNNLDTSKLTGIISLTNGGLGFSTINKFNFVYASDTNKLSGLSNMKWDTSLNSLLVDGAINIGDYNFTGNGYNIRNVNAANIVGLLPVNQGGTGVQSFESGKIIIGGSTSLVQSANLTWQEELKKLGIGKVPTANLDVAGDIKCDRLQVGDTIITAESGVSSIVNASAIAQGIVRVSHGGTGSNFYNPGELLYGNGINNLLTSRALAWDNSKNTLNVSNINVFDNILLNGVNTSNLDANKIINIISLSNGGIGTSNINKGELLFGVDNRKLGSTSNIKWDDVNLILRVQSNIFASNIYSCNFSGNGFQLNNLDTSKLTGIVSLTNGGLGFSTIDKFNFVYASDTNKLSGLSNMKWDTSLNSLLVDGAINIGNCNFTGNGTNIKNVSAANIIGLLPINRGGTGVQSFESGKIVIGGSTSLAQSTNLTWQEELSKLGIGKVPTANLDVAGDIKCDRLQVGQTIITANAGISTIIDASAIAQGIVGTSYGGTGSSNLIPNQLLIGNDTNPVLQTSNLVWNKDTISLGIGNPTPLKTLDVNGDVNFNGTLFNNYVKVPSITSIKQSPDTEEVIYTDKQFFIGYSNNDNYKFKVNGNVYVAGYITGLSDVRYKTNISNITQPIDKIEKLQGVYYNLLDEEKRSIGLIAQEVEKIIPEVVYTNTDNTKSIAYGNMIAVVIESIKELSMRIKKLEEKL